MTVGTSNAQRRSWTLSLAANAVVLAILVLVSNWRFSVKNKANVTQSEKREYESFFDLNKEFFYTPHSERSLESINKNTDFTFGWAGLVSFDTQQQPAFDDDITRDEACRQYLMNFLNGTTDAKDECQGMSNAWSAADCKDDSKLNLGRKHTDENGNITDDSVVIDDVYVQWECCVSISDFYGKNCREASLNAWRLCGIVAVLIFCGLVKSWIKSVTALRWVPDAGIYVLVGAIFGGILRLFNHRVVKEFMAFDNDLFLHILLPPIVFQAALTIDKRAFRRDLFPILTFAILGTAISAVTIGFMTHKVSSWFNSLTTIPLLDSLIFGSLISSIDPVATLGLLTSMGVGQGDTLYTLIFGESLLNDGVAIVLFDSLVRHVGDNGSVDRQTIMSTIYNFVIVIAASMLIGLAFGALSTLYFWGLQAKHTAVSEVALFFSWALVPYYFADALEMSGIISIMVMGFMMDYYVVGGNQSDEGEWMEYMAMRCASDSTHPVEPQWERVRVMLCKAFSGRGLIMSRSRQHVGFVAEVVSTLMETSIFAYLGLFLFNDKVSSIGLLGTGVMSCIASRAGVVVLLALLINACVWIDLEGRITRVWRNRNLTTPLLRNEMSMDDDTVASQHEQIYLDIKTQIVLFSAGVRGAVSYALVQNIPVYDAVTKHGSHYKAELKAMTSATIAVLLFSFGALTYFTINHNPRRNDRDGEIPHPLHHRLMSVGLTSLDEDAMNDMVLDSNQNSLEIEGRRPLHD